MLPDSADEPAVELRRAREILNNITTDPAVDRELERLNQMYQAVSPPDSAASSSVMFSQPNTAMALGQDPISGDMKHLVYPVGQTAGIDPFHADHIHNIPYTRPLSNPNTMTESATQITPPPSKEQMASIWAGGRQPRVLLVEDDKICMRIGSKFLSQVDCSVETAVSGLVGRVGFVLWLTMGNSETGPRRSPRSTTIRRRSISSLWTSSCPCSTVFRRRLVFGWLRRGYRSLL